MPVLQPIIDRIARNETISRDEALAFASDPALRADLFDTSAEATKRFASRIFNICGIVSIKTGACSCNCKWCAQSTHWTSSSIPIHPILPVSEVDAAAERAAAGGITRFSLVASGRKPSARETRMYAEHLKKLRSTNPKLELCASLGLLNEKDLAVLKDAGLVRVHCNLETSERFFPQVCSSHTWEDKVKTIRAAKAAGLEVCSGGLFGMGETAEDRIDLAFALRELEVPSIPLNLLDPRPGTPLEHAPKLSEDHFLTTVALYRLINPQAELRFAGGRLQLSEYAVREAMRIGVNSAICGSLLTTDTMGPTAEAERFMAAGYEADEVMPDVLERSGGTDCEEDAVCAACAS